MNFVADILMGSQLQGSNVEFCVGDLLVARIRNSNCMFVQNIYSEVAFVDFDTRQLNILGAWKHYFDGRALMCMSENLMLIFGPYVHV